MINLEEFREAFKAVKTNNGCAGTDCVTIESFEGNLEFNLKTLLHELTTQSYKPYPLLKILVDKGNGEARALCIPSVRDRIAQAAVLKQIDPILDKEFEVCSYAYRKGHSVKEAVYKIKELHEEGYSWVVDADIDQFFDNVDHNILMDKFTKYVSEQFLQNLVKIWLKAEIWDGNTIYVPKNGIPQGAPISPILGNLFLDELDEEMLKKGYKIIRYSDDFIVLCKNKDEAVSALKFSIVVLEKHMLELDEEDITSFDEGFKFLGVTFIRNFIMKPFDTPKRVHKVLHYPKQLNFRKYINRRDTQF